MDMSPLIAVHLTAALGAVAVGPVALWARRAGALRPQLHRAAGYAWVTLMLLTATSAIFIQDYQLPNIAGYTPIHLLIPVVYGMLFLAFWFLAKGNFTGHRRTMQGLYAGACVVAGAFTLLPGRLLGELIWVEWLGLLPPHVHPISTPTQGPSVIAQILTNTPVWVWGLLAALLLLGFSQTRDRSASLTRIVLMPLGLGAFSLWGTVSAFGATVSVLGSWVTATTLLLLIVTQLPLSAGTRYDHATRQFQLPGSWVPMALIMGIFMTKYIVGVNLMLHPELKNHANFSLAISTLYGVFSGIFAGRAVRLMRLALRQAPSSSASMTVLNA